MAFLPSFISDDRVDPFTGGEKPRPIQLPTPTTPDEVHPCVFIPEQGWNGIKLFEEPQAPKDAEVPNDKFKLYQESAPGSGIFSVQFLQIDVTDEPSAGQFKVAWGSGTGLVKMSVADLTSTTGKLFACVYDGLGTISAALYHLVAPPGSVIDFLPGSVLAGAYTLVEMRQLGWAVMDGTTAIAQGILDPVINGVLPDLVTARRFRRASNEAGAGVAEAHAVQYHWHTKDIAHSHTTDIKLEFAGAGPGPVEGLIDASSGFFNQTNQYVSNVPALNSGDADPVNASGHDPVNVAEETRPNAYSFVPLIKVK